MMNSYLLIHYDPLSLYGHVDVNICVCSLSCAEGCSNIDDDHG